MILLLALCLRLPQLNDSFWLDEAAQALQSARPWNQQLLIRDDFQPPLMHVLTHGLMQLSTNEAWLRTGTALIPGLLTVWLTIRLGRPLGSPVIGWLAGLFLATSSFHLFYSQELRPYSLPAFWATLGWWLLLDLTRSTERHRASSVSSRQLILLGVTTAAGLYSSYLYPFVLLGQLSYLLMCWRQTAASGRAMGVLMVGSASFLPWIPSFLAQLQAGQELRTLLPGWEQVVSFDQLKIVALTAGKYFYGVLDLAITPAYVLTTLLFVGVITTMSWQARRHPQLVTVRRVLLCGVLIPFLTAWLISFWVPVLQPKRVLFVWPLISLGLGWLIWAYWQLAPPPRRSWLGLLAPSLGLLLVTVQLFSSWAYLTQSRYQRENWRQVQQQIMVKYPPSQSVVVMAFPGPFASWEWYNRQRYPTFATGVYRLSDDPTQPDRVRLKALTQYQYVLVFDYLRDLTDPQRAIETELARYGYQQVDVLSGNQSLGAVRVFARARQILGYSEY